MTDAVPPAKQCTMSDCSREAVEPDHPPEADSPDANPGGDVDASRSTDTVEFTRTESGTYPPTLLEREQWMGRLADAKRPFAPWADRDHPEAGDDTGDVLREGVRCSDHAKDLLEVTS